MTQEEATEHNEKVIRNIMIALIKSGLADPVRLIADKTYATEQIMTYIQAANITREILHMPKLYLIDTNEIDWYEKHWRKSKIGIWKL